MGQNRKHLTDLAAGMFLFAAACVVFGRHSSSLGFYSDDAGFLVELGKADFPSTLHQMLHYVPGRNLHVLWQKILFCVAGSGPEALGRLHAIQAALDAGTAVLLYVFLRTLRISVAPSLAAACLFAFYPNHGETHFWLSAAPMNILSTAFILAYGILTIVLARRIRTPADLAANGWLALLEFLCFGCALFTYDQSLAPLLLLFGVKAGMIFLRNPPFRSLSGMAFLLLAGAGHLALAALDVYLKLAPTSGPTISNVNSGHIGKTVREVLCLHVPHPFFKGEFLRFLKTGTHGDVLLAAVVTGLIACLLVLASNGRRTADGTDGALRTDTAEEPAAGPSVAWYAFTALLGLGLFAAAYGPCLIWYISPRHNYLPTVGLTVVVASLAAGVLAWCEGKRLWLLRTAVGATLVTLVGYEVLRHLGVSRPTSRFGVATVLAVTAALALVRRAPRTFLMHLASSALLGLWGVYVFGFIGATTAEKKLWADSYKIRKSFYATLSAEADFPQKKVLVCQGFPALYEEVVPFFVHDNWLALQYLFPDRSAVEMSLMNTFLDATQGAVQDTVAGKGKPAAYPPHMVLEVVFKQLNGRTVLYSRSRG